ncbi:MAG: hypothetical protein PF481_06610 [Bacteroidales bacterium]|jgi:hypothetical protein|nr:hypothetical protein [Bacteroidales bacterium]
MNRLILLSFIVCFAGFGYGQVDNYTIVASKTYDNNTKTVYLELNGTLDSEIAGIIKKTLEEQPDIHTFSFYAEPNYNKCMYTANVSVHEDAIIALINEVVSEMQSAPVSEIQFVDQERKGYYYKVNFKLDYLPKDDVVKAIYHSLKQSDFIINVNYLENAHFEIFSFRNLYPKEINQLIKQYDIKISEAGITQK